MINLYTRHIPKKPVLKLYTHPISRPIPNDPEPSLMFNRAQWDYERVLQGDVPPLWDWKKPSADEYCQAVDDYISGRVKDYRILRDRMTYSLEYLRMIKGGY